MYLLLPYRQLLPYAITYIISTETLLCCAVYKQINTPFSLPPEHHAAFLLSLMHCLTSAACHRGRANWEKSSRIHLMETLIVWVPNFLSRNPCAVSLAGWIGAGSHGTCAAVVADSHLRQRAHSLLRWLGTLTAINSPGLILPSVLTKRWMCLWWKVLDFNAGWVADCCDLGRAVWLMQLTRL